MVVSKITIQQVNNIELLKKWVSSNNSKISFRWRVSSGVGLKSMTGILFT